jgi:hypothetical protein
VELVLECLYKNQLHCKPEKCEFFKNSVEFLGHIVKHNQIKMDPRKLDVIKDWETPKSIKDIRRFHGTCNFYRRFIKDFSKITAPLNELLKEEEFSWTKEAQIAFNELKKTLLSKSVIQPFDPVKPK